MKLLVTGGAGYIGSICVEELLANGHDVVVVDNLKQGHRSAVAPGAVFHEGDFGDGEILEGIFSKHNIDAVFHFAAETTVEDSMTDPEKYFINNLGKGLALLGVMRKYNCNRFIFSSTAATFGEPEFVPLDETHSQKPINAYGESKLMFEKVLAWYHRAYDFKVMAFRYFNAAGASSKLGEDHDPESHLIPIVLDVALGKREYINIFGTDYETDDGTCIRDYVHVIDLARAHILGLDHLDRYGCQFYNLGNGEGYSVNQVIEAARQITGHPIPCKNGSRRSGDPARLVASSRLIKEEMNWSPQFPGLNEIIESAWNWHQDNPNGYEN